MTNAAKLPRSAGWKWVLGVGLAAVIAIVGVFTGASIVGRRFDQYIREQAIQYLEERFDSEVELAKLRIHVPRWAVLRLMRRGPAELVTVDGEGLLIRHRGRRDVPPLIELRNFAAAVNLRTLFDNPKTIPVVTLDGMQINIPPKGERPVVERADEAKRKSGVMIERVIIHNATLSILPKDISKEPLRFDLHNIQLDSTGRDAAMNYDGVLRNPKPPGEIHSKGTFGPWTSGEPSQTPLTGTYLFENADLGVFNGIAGTLRSTGQFEGRLGSITARGEASVPDFRLKGLGNAVPLTTKFEVLVDGTNGNTTLQPVRARLGSTNFTTSGVIIRHEGQVRKTISLDVAMPAGKLRDLLRLSMKGSPFMEGTVALHTKLSIPPLTGKIKEKLLLDGTFDVTNGKFLRSKIQAQIDGLSRKAQGQPKNEEIDQVVSHMTGVFKLENEVLTFKTLAFMVPGASVNIAGTYDLGGDLLDLRGALMLQAKVSQTQSGWKRWVLKPVDPFFAKNGAGTYLKIKVAGTAKEPTFGRDR